MVLLIIGTAMCGPVPASSSTVSPTQGVTSTALALASSSPHLASVSPTVLPATPSQISAVQSAIAGNRLTVPAGTDWEGLFVGVTAEEARQLLGEAAKTQQFKYVLPFDPRGGGFTITTAIGNDQINSVHVLIDGLQPGHRFYAPFDGGAFQSEGRSAAGDLQSRAIQVRSGGMQFAANVGPLTTVLMPQFGTGDLKRVTLGSTLFKSSSDAVVFRNTSHSVTFQIATGPDADIARLSMGGIIYFTGERLESINFSQAALPNLLQKQGKIVFILEQ